MTTWSPEQQKNAKLIIAVGRLLSASDRDIQIALMTAMQESSLRNLSGGDRDSVGLFQQRPSQGWGTPAQLMRPDYSSRKFYNALFKIKDREAMSLTQAAQAVQRSGHPDAYAKWEKDAAALMGDVKENAPLGGTVSTVESIGNASKNVEGVFQTLGSSAFWKRAGVVAAGVVMVVAGASIMLSGSDIVKKGVGAATAIATKGVIK